MPGPRILVVRLSSMGDVIHTLPAAASLKHSLPHSHLTWVVNPRWRPLLEGNPFIDEIVEFNRRSLTSILAARRRLRERRYDLAVDFQGLIQSAMVAAAARPEKLIGFGAAHLKEKPAALFYSATADPRSKHVVDWNLELAAAAGATNPVRSFPLPEGVPEGSLPAGRFVLTSPLAGWASKQWPTANLIELAKRLESELGVPLILNGAPSNEAELRASGTRVHLSGIPGLIDATRRAAAVLGVDSGPLHLAAALGKPGVALFGPTDPERNGPYGGSIATLRTAGAETTYKRDREIAASMRALTVDQVFAALAAQLAKSGGGSRDEAVS
ncbi:MAG: glycosyltransferase family 9 protein [Bryobacteraceae bacterium]